MFYPFWSAGLIGRVENVKANERLTRGEAHAAAVEAEALGERVGQLTLACAAMWSMLKQHGHTDDELRALMEEIDLRDGKSDGKLAPDTVECTGCGRKAKSTRRNCLYCGAELPRGPAFGATP